MKNRGYSRAKNACEISDVIRKKKMLIKVKTEVIN